ncbi:unnamed protein product [Oppiella nova]|uniref:Uncharacterized protein n=1 Tax=Oppiella nova TaxID=334625 RepID=A0A7R9QMX3_9ACAR|nr:unnamed protein product [Oppiella nova]CAG2169130.1 unnamed protein product [Oppiella nova]
MSVMSPLPHKMSNEMTDFHDMWQDIESVLLISDGSQYTPTSETHRYILSQTQPPPQTPQPTHQHLNTSDIYVKQEYNQIKSEYDYHQNETYEQSVPYVENNYCNVSQWSATQPPIQCSQPSHQMQCTTRMANTGAKDPMLWMPSLQQANQSTNYYCDQYNNPYLHWNSGHYPYSKPSVLQCQISPPASPENEKQHSIQTWGLLYPNALHTVIQPHQPFPTSEA